MFWLVTRDNENLIKFRVKNTIDRELFYIKWQISFGIIIKKKHILNMISMILKYVPTKSNLKTYICEVVFYLSIFRFSNLSVLKRVYMSKIASIL